MKIYLDNCCYNRPYDDRNNIKNYLEREAIMIIFELSYAEEISIVGSETLEKEISVMPDIIRKDNVRLLYENQVTERIKLNPLIVKRAKELAEKIGTRPFDSLHLATAENNVDYFITVDVKLIKAGNRIHLPYKIMNPIEFIMEVTRDD